MNRDMTSQPGPGSRGVLLNPGASLKSPISGEHDIIGALMLEHWCEIESFVWCCVFSVSCLGFCRLQGDSLAPAGAEEEPAAHVPEQAVPEVTCE